MLDPRVGNVWTERPWDAWASWSRAAMPLPDPAGASWQAVALQLNAPTEMEATGFSQRTRREVRSRSVTRVSAVAVVAVTAAKAARV